MKLPLVSIIIPAHNRISWLEQTIDSVISQTYHKIEIIIVDDASDPPIQSLLKVKDPRLTILRQDDNLGPGEAREVGRKAASGEYINYLDSDDCLHPQKIELQIEMLTARPNASMCYCTSLVFSKLPINGDEPVWSISNQEHTAILPVILYQRPWATGACLWRKETTDRIGEWSSLWVGEDIEYEVRAGCLEVEIAHLPRSLCYIRRNQDENQLSTFGLKRYMDSAYYLISCATYLLSSPFAQDQFVRFRIIQYLLNIGIFLLNQNQKKLADQCLDMLNRFLGTSKKKRQIIKYYRVMAKYLPSSLSSKIGRKIRPMILSELRDQKFILELKYPLSNSSMLLKK